jgi:hypothetical protein
VRGSTGIFTALCMLVFVMAAEGGDAKPSGYVVLDDKSTQLKNDFNNAKGSVRLLFVVDPVCPGCLRGLDDVNRDLLAKVDDPRLQTFVVHVPVIGAKAKDVAPAGTLLKNRHVRHYWNASGEFGRSLSAALQLKNAKEDVYAWDVWLVYGPDAEWTGTAPPQPQLFMHQLWKLQGTKYAQLDSKAFAKYAKELLAQRAKQ